MIDADLANRIMNFMPFVQQITYKSRTSGDTFTDYTVTRASSGKTKKLMPRIDSLRGTAEILQQGELTWEFAAVDLPVTPRTLDEIVDSSSTLWIVLEVIMQLNGNMYILSCRKGV